LTEEGELLIRGPQVMQGYHGNKEATDAIFDQGEGWMHTGDVAKFDEHGQLFITDRCKELIKYKGFQVAPAELEALLLTHPGVNDVVVIPVQNEEAGEHPRAYVVRKPDTPEVTEEELCAMVAKALAPHKKLRGGVVFTSVVPKSASGKILRRIQVAEDRANYPNGTK
jgi:acyl-CoA synthetase (AMP-forming)/AMP-acid ligase II